MDPFTQAGIGAALAVALSSREQVRLAAVVGAVAGMAPDLDVLIRSNSDPLLSLEYHRHFSHALITAPLIGVLIAIIFKLLLFRSKVPFKKFVLYAIAGALTHGPIDACTSYGTSLYWPFSNYRESWDLISIIDPIFTLPLLMLTGLAFKVRVPFFAQLALVLCLLYLGFCGIQHSKAAHIAEQLSIERRHQPERYSIRPSLGNSFLWRTIYEHKGRYYVDAVWVGLNGERRIYKGRSVEPFTVEDSADYVSPNSVLGQDIERFRFFSQGYLYEHPTRVQILGDLRYSMYPDSIIPLWGIRVDPAAKDNHAELLFFRELSEVSFERLWKMIRSQKVEPLRY